LSHPGALPAAAGLSRLIKAATDDVVLPSVVTATDPIVLDASEKQIGSAVHAPRIKKPCNTVAWTEQNEVLA
jgi:hypothetical protein